MNDPGATSSILVVVRNFDQTFLTPSMRGMKSCNRIVLSTAFDDGWSLRLRKMPNAHALIGAFIQIVLVAARCPTRGVLLDADGPLDAAEVVRSRFLRIIAARNSASRVPPDQQRRGWPLDITAGRLSPNTQARGAAAGD